MIEVPNWDGNTAHPFPSVTLRIDFRGPDIGTFVFHCHILNHEDLGMMNIVQVVAADSANHNPAKKAPASGSVGGVAKSAGTSKASPTTPAAAPGTEKMKMN
jgi:hypothetical protein